MAILDTSVTGSFNEDRDENVFIGLDLPIRKSDGVDGYFASTSTTLTAVKNNIRNLLLTNRGERFLQPNLGLSLRRFLFEQYTSDLQDSIKAEIIDTINFWLPFVTVTELRVNMEEASDGNINNNKLNIVTTFSIRHAPNILESVEVDITGD